ncbi:hypothetical protein R4K48_04975 [Brachyspira pulli]|uniref:hypothetical protein n=1 Tax=Brachyspira pulli TaxID=310721 RepID=UPI0030057782
MIQVIILKIIKSKYFYIALILISILSYISFLNVKLNSKTKEINNLNTKIVQLQSNNILLQKEIIFKEKQDMILENFSNSDKAIKKIKYKKLSDETINAFNSIVSNYYKSLKE